MSSPPAGPPTVRIRRAPYYDPPYDDERPPESWGTPVQPPLEWDPPPPVVRRPRARPQPPASPGPPVRATAARFVNTCLEVLNGLRPAAHLRQLCRPLEAQEVVTTMTLAARRLQRATPRPAAGRPALIRLRRMRLCEPHPGILEIAAAIGTPERTWAAAFRLERRHARWQCTAAAIL